MSDTSKSRKQGMADDELRENDRQLRLLVENMGDVISRHLPDSTITYVSPSCRALLGYTPKELVHTPAADYVHPDDLQTTLATIEDAVERHAEHYRVQHRMKRKDGDYVWVGTVGRLSYGPGGHLHEIQCVVRDNTEAKQAEEKLRIAKEFSENLVETANAIVVTLNSEAGVTTFNSYAEELTGYKKAEVIGRNWFDVFIPQRDQETIPKVFKEALGKMPEASQHENLIVTRSGEERLIKWSNSVLRDRCGNIDGLLSIGLDITDRKRAEEERETFLHDIGERDKKLRCMYGVAESIRTRSALEDIFQDTAELIPPGWHYPEFTRGKVIFDGKEFVSEPFQETKWKQSSDIVVNGQPRGSIEVYYLKEYRELDEGPFMTEERNLINGIAKTLSEVVERKRAEEKTSRFSHLLERSLNEFYTFDAETLRFVNVNYGARENLGYSMEELRGLTPLDLKPEFTPESFAEFIKPLREGNQERVEFTTVHQRKDGTRYPVEVHLQLMTADTPVFVAFIVDISERKKAEEERERSRQTLQKILDSMPFGVAIIDKKKILRKVNSAALAMMQYDSEDQVVGRECHETLCTCPRDKCPILDLGLNTGVAERTLVAKDKTKIPILKSVIRIMLDDEEVLLETFVDITDRKRAEIEREDLIAKLETQNAELERFTYTVSHDLKSPLITIQGYVGALREDLAEGVSGPVEDDLSRISNAAGKMDRLLNDVLELSRIGRLVGLSEDVSLGELAHEVLETIDGQARENGVQVEISPDLPVVFGDRLRLSEVLQNLIDNAVKYMGDQSQPRVEIGSRRDGSEVICYVRDNGIGIEPRYHERIFGLFDQLNPKMEGSGIGLALVKRIVEVHGGRVWIESEGKGHGSTFCFTIATRSESSESGRGESDSASRLSPSDGQPLAIVDR